jgi:hypothetical protein
LRLARAAYTAAEYPAGPEPKMIRRLCLTVMYDSPLFAAPRRPTPPVRLAMDCRS